MQESNRSSESEKNPFMNKVKRFKDLSHLISLNDCFENRRLYEAALVEVERNDKLTEKEALEVFRTQLYEDLKEVIYQGFNRLIRKSYDIYTGKFIDEEYVFKLPGKTIK